MKFSALAALFFMSSLAFADGPIAHQASEAVEVATNMFSATQTPEIAKQFQSINATKVGHEQFAIVITLNDGKTAFAYMCEENESVQPVIWECAAR